ncbi:MAG: ECF-type sigma factor [Rhodanobacteraceae bacterium]
MPEAESTAVSELIRRHGGDDTALIDRVFPLVYAELRQIAHRALQRAYGNRTLSTTVLVHETYLRLAAREQLPLASRKHLFALCARAMRQIVIDHARRRQADKRGGHATVLSLTAVEPGAEQRPELLVALDQALIALETHDPRLVRLIEYRVFAGLDNVTIAELLELSPRSVQRDWRRARAWIGSALGGDGYESIGDEQPVKR